MKNIYGFKVLDINGNGFKRWFNGETELITDNPLGRLPDKLHYINVAQNVLDFSSAFNYCSSSANEHELVFAALTEADWNKVQHPVKRFFKSLTKRLNIGIS